VDFPGTGTIDLSAPKLPSNDREMLEVATERMFVEPSILDTIASVASALRQYEGVGGSAPPAVSEVAERVLKESTAGTKSVVVVSAPSPAWEGTSASLPDPVEAAATAPAATVVDVAEDVVKGAGPSSPRPVTAVAEEVLVSSEPVAAPQEHDAPEGTTRATSLEIQEVEEGTGATLSLGAASGEAQALELACTPWEAAFEADDDAKDDKEVAVCNTLERGLEWAHRSFDKLILPSTLVSFLA
jgi:hypothetical protein